jgi:hypothetical protein
MVDPNSAQPGFERAWQRGMVFLPQVRGHITLSHVQLSISTSFSTRKKLGSCTNDERLGLGPGDNISREIFGFPGTYLVDLGDLVD